jgi:hypothetical protein
MEPRWELVDKLVHELGSLRAAVDEIEAVPDLAEAEVTRELRACLDRAADVVHLVIGGDAGMVSDAWRTIASAQLVSRRAAAALENAKVLHGHTKTLYGDSAILKRDIAVTRQETRQQIRRLQEMYPAGVTAGQRPRGPGKAK